MTKDQLLTLFDKTLQNCRETMVGKNNDYAGDSDPLKNFHSYAIVGVDPRKGILTRMVDKVSRLSNFAEGKEMKIVDEKVDDTIEDLINYAVLLRAAFEAPKPMMHVSDDGSVSMSGRLIRPFHTVGILMEDNSTADGDDD